MGTHPLRQAQNQLYNIKKTFDPSHRRRPGAMYMCLNVFMLTLVNAALTHREDIVIDIVLTLSCQELPYNGEQGGVRRVRPL